MNPNSASVLAAVTATLSGSVLRHMVGGGDLTMSHGALAEKVEVLESILNNLGEGVVVADTSGRFLFFNSVAERILGMGAEDVDPTQWSSTYGCFLPDGVTLFPTDRLPLVQALEGREVEEQEIFVRNHRVPHGVWISVSGRPLKDKEGVLNGGLAIVRDITLRKQACDMVGRLGQALEQTADGVVITDNLGVIEYVNPAFELITGYSKHEVLGQTPRFLKSGLHDSEFYSRLWATILGGAPFRGTVTNRKKNGDLFWIEQTITPMKDRDGRITHFVSVLKDVTEARRAQDQEIQLRLARELQQRLYPTAPLAIPGFEIAGAAHPAHATGGDYFDFVSLRNGDLAVAIGDVSGHGFSAAIVMAETRAYLRALADTNSDPGEVLGTVNRALSADLENGQYVTLLLAVLDPHTRSLRYSSAGHLPTYVLDGEGATKAVLDSTGVPLGLFCGCQFRSGEAVNLAPGDIIVFLTDGVTEAQSLAHGEFGVQKALEVVAAHRRLSARELVGKVLEAVVEHTGNQPQLDDVSCVICKAVQ